MNDPERRDRADRDFRFFCESYFPHLFTLPWSADHHRVIAKIERVVMAGDTLAFAMPRGAGKTTLCHVAVVWAILAGHHRFVMLIDGTEDRSSQSIGNVKRHLITNDRLLEDYPEAVYPLRSLEGEARRTVGQRYYGVPTQVGWGADQIVLGSLPGARCSGAVVKVSSITGNIRGALYVRGDGTQVRPTLVLCDDPQTDQSARSPLQTAERLAIINGAIAGLAGPGQRTAILIPCTVIQAGDMADQLLDRDRHPDWRGERTKMIYSFPSEQKLWAEYARIREDAIRAGGDGHEATEFYAAHRDAMDAGAEVSWAERFTPGREISALQHAMNLRQRYGAEAFAAEYQNEPVLQQAAATALTPRQVAERFNGRPRGQAPLETVKVTAFVDVHQQLLFWCVCAWTQEFTGYVLDYGEHPDQRRAFFSLQNIRRTLGRAHPGAGEDGAIRSGLDELIAALLAREFPKAGGGVLRIDRLLCDAGYKPGIVVAVKHRVGGATMWPSRGVGIKAGNKPISGYVRKPGWIFGEHWYSPNVRGTSEFPYAAIDVNFWKSFVHERLAVTPGDPGALTLFGQSPDEHGLFAEHIAGSETWVQTLGHGRQVQEWKTKPGSPDNHWLDCLVGCAAAAAMLNISAGTVTVQAAPRRRRRTRVRYLEDRGR